MGVTLSLRGDGRQRVSGVGAGQQPLHVDHIQPAAELEPDLAEEAHLLKTQARVQSDAGFVGGVDHGEDRMQAALCCGVDQRGKEARSETASAPVFGDVDGILRGEPVSDAVMETVEGAPTDDSIHGMLGDEDGVTIALMGVEPFKALFEGAWLVVVRGGGAEDGVVVNGKDARAILSARGANGDVVRDGIRGGVHRNEPGGEGGPKKNSPGTIRG